MGLNDFRRDRRQFNRLNHRLRTLLLILSAVLIVISVALAVTLFIYVLNIASNPIAAKTLVDQWSSIFLDSSASPSAASGAAASPFNGPARWLAVITLIVLSYLLIRIPLLMLQMGTQLMMSCQEDNRQLRGFVQQVLQELRSEENNVPPPPDAG